MEGSDRGFLLGTVLHGQKNSQKFQSVQPVAGPIFEAVPHEYKPRTSPPC